MQREILRPTADLVFKRIFGQEKEITIEVINLLIDPPYPVVDLEFLSQEILPDIYNGKVSIVDVRCTDAKNQHFILEMQVVNHIGFEKRVLLYAARAYSQQLKRGMQYDKVQSVFLLSIVNHQIRPDNEKWIHRMSMRENTDPYHEISGINLVFIELEKRKKLGNFNLNDPIDRWLSFLAEPEKMLTMPKFDISVYPNLMKAVELLDQSNYSEEQLREYDKHLMAVYDINTSYINYFDKGYDEGLEKGISQGKEAIISILKELKEKKLSLSEIAEKYRISLDQVTELKAELK